MLSDESALVWPLAVKKEEPTGETSAFPKRESCDVIQPIEAHGAAGILTSNCGAAWSAVKMPASAPSTMKIKKEPTEVELWQLYNSRPQAETKACSRTSHDPVIAPEIKLSQKEDITAVKEEFPAGAGLGGACDSNQPMVTSDVPTRGTVTHGTHASAAQVNDMVTVTNTVEKVQCNTPLLALTNIVERVQCNTPMLALKGQGQLTVGNVVNNIPSALKITRQLPNPGGVTLTANNIPNQVLSVSAAVNQHASPPGTPLIIGGQTLLLTPNPVLTPNPLNASAVIGQTMIDIAHNGLSPSNAGTNVILVPTHLNPRGITGQTLFASPITTVLNRQPSTNVATQIITADNVLMAPTPMLLGGNTTLVTLPGQSAPYAITGQSALPVSTCQSAASQLPCQSAPQVCRSAVSQLPCQSAPQVCQSAVSQLPCQSAPQVITGKKSVMDAGALGKCLSSKSLIPLMPPKRKVPNQSALGETVTVMSNQSEQYAIPRWKPGRARSGLKGCPSSESTTPPMPPRKPKPIQNAAASGATHQPGAISDVRTPVADTLQGDGNSDDRERTVSRILDKRNSNNRHPGQSLTKEKTTKRKRVPPTQHKKPTKIQKQMTSQKPTVPQQTVTQPSQQKPQPAKDPNAHLIEEDSTVDLVLDVDCRADCSDSEETLDNGNEKLSSRADQISSVNHEIENALYTLEEPFCEDTVSSVEGTLVDIDETIVTVPDLHLPNQVHSITSHNNPVEVESSGRGDESQQNPEKLSGSEEELESCEIIHTVNSISSAGQDESLPSEDMLIVCVIESEERPSETQDSPSVSRKLSPSPEKKPFSSDICSEGNSKVTKHRSDAEDRSSATQEMSNAETQVDAAAPCSQLDAMSTTQENLSNNGQSLGINLWESAVGKSKSLSSLVSDVSLMTQDGTNLSHQKGVSSHNEPEDAHPASVGKLAVIQNNDSSQDKSLSQDSFHTQTTDINPICHEPSSPDSYNTMALDPSGEESSISFPAQELGIGQTSQEIPATQQLVIEDSMNSVLTEKDVQMAEAMIIVYLGSLRDESSGQNDAAGLDLERISGTGDSGPAAEDASKTDVAPMTDAVPTDGASINNDTSIITFGGRCLRQRQIRKSTWSVREKGYLHDSRCSCCESVPVKRKNAKKVEPKRKPVITKRVELKRAPLITKGVESSRMKKLRAVRSFLSSMNRGKEMVDHCYALEPELEECPIADDTYVDAPVRESPSTGPITAEEPVQNNGNDSGSESYDDDYYSSEDEANREEFSSDEYDPTEDDPRYFQRKEERMPKEKKPKKTERKEKIPKMKKKYVPASRLKKRTWEDMETRFSCKMCGFETGSVETLCSHHLRDHSEFVVDLREFLLKTKVRHEGIDESLYDFMFGSGPTSPVSKDLVDEHVNGKREHSCNVGRNSLGNGSTPHSGGHTSHSREGDMLEDCAMYENGCTEHSTEDDSYILTNERASNKGEGAADHSGSVDGYSHGNARTKHVSESDRSIHGNEKTSHAKSSDMLEDGCPSQHDDKDMADKENKMALSGGSREVLEQGSIMSSKEGHQCPHGNNGVIGSSEFDEDALKKRAMGHYSETPMVGDKSEVPDSVSRKETSGLSISGATLACQQSEDVPKNERIVGSSEADKTVLETRVADPGSSKYERDGLGNDRSTLGIEGSIDILAKESIQPVSQYDRVTLERTGISKDVKPMPGDKSPIQPPEGNLGKMDVESPAHAGNDCREGIGGTVNDRQKIIMNTAGLYPHILTYTSVKFYCPHCRLERTKRCDSLSFVHRCCSSPRRHLCEKCGKTFVREYLKRHLEMHHGTTNFPTVQCHLCGKEMISKRLPCHMFKVHPKKKVNSLCNICGKTFAWKNQLVRHQRIHMKVYPFRCSVCQKGFAQKTNLRTHMRQHTGEQPYKCGQCPKSFTNNVCLKSHLKKYHGIDLWKLGHTGGGRPKKSDSSSKEEKSLTAKVVNDPLKVENNLSSGEKWKTLKGKNATSRRPKKGSLSSKERKDSSLKGQKDPTKGKNGTSKVKRCSGGRPQKKNCSSNEGYHSLSKRENYPSKGNNGTICRAGRLEKNNLPSRKINDRTLKGENEENDCLSKGNSCLSKGQSASSSNRKTQKPGNGDVDGDARHRISLNEVEGGEGLGAHVKSKPSKRGRGTGRTGKNGEGEDYRSESCRDEENSKATISKVGGEVIRVSRSGRRVKPINRD